MKTLGTIVLKGIAAGVAGAIPVVGPAIAGAIMASAQVDALNALVGLFNPSRPPETTESALKTSRPPRVSAYGTSRLYGAYCLYETAEDGTAVDVYAVHDGKIDGVEATYLGDEVVALDGDAVEEGDDGRYRNEAVKLYYTDGSTPGTAFADVISLLPGIWTSDHRGDGVVMMALTAASVKLKRFQETYPQSQVPIPSMVARWQLCPDPANVDPTNEAAWTWTENPARQLLHYKLVREGVDFATKIEPAIDSWITAAEDCDDATALKVGGTEARYRSCVAHKHTDQHKDVIGALLATFDGWISPRSDGAYTIYSGRYYEPTVSIGSDEIVSYTWDGVGIDDNEAVNEIIVSYVSADHDYNTVEGEAWTDEADISARGQVLSQPLDVQVPSFPQARRLAKRKMARIMAPTRGTVTTNVAGRAVRGERYIDLHIEEAGSIFFSGPAEITGLTRNMATGGVTFTWVAADPDIDDWDPATEEGEPAALGERVAPQPLVAPTITTAAFFGTDNSSSGTPGARIRIAIEGPDRDDLTWFARWRTVGADTWGTELEYSDVAAGASVVLETDFVPTDADVEVEVAYQVGDGRVSAWSASAVAETTATITADNTEETADTTGITADRG